MNASGELVMLLLNSGADYIDMLDLKDTGKQVFRMAVSVYMSTRSV